MRRGGIAVCGAFALACITSTAVSRPVATPIPTLDIEDYNSREDCLNKTVCRMAYERGRSPETVEAIAISATGICSAPLWTKILIRAQRHVDGLSIDDGISQREIDRLQTERHAAELAATCHLP